MIRFSNSLGVRSALLALAMLMSGLMTFEAAAHTVRWPQNSCRTSLSGHCKAPKPQIVADQR